MWAALGAILMQTFSDAFTKAESETRHLIEEFNFSLSGVGIQEIEGTTAVYGSARYVEAHPTTHDKDLIRSVNLFIAPVRLELNLSIECGKWKFDLDELCYLEGHIKYPQRSHDMYKAMYDSEQLKCEFENLFFTLRAAGSRFFKNDLALWSDLNNQRLSRLLIEKNERIFQKAEVAFKAKNWSEVVNLLEGKQDKLSKLNRGRLNYAKQHLIKST